MNISVSALTLLVGNRNGIWPVINMFCSTYLHMQGHLYLYLTMVKLSHDQFGGVVLFKNGNLILKKKLRVNQHNFHHRCPIIFNKNFVWGPCGADRERPPWPSIRTSPGWGELRLCCLGV